MVRKGSTSTVEKRKNIRLNNLKNPKQPNVSAENLDFLLDQSKYTLDLVNTWINGADTKVSVSCGIFSVIIAAIVFAAENILGNIEITEQVNAAVYSLFHITLLITAIMFLCTIIFHFWAIKPNFSVEKTAPKKPRFSIFYYEIQNFERPEEYIKSAREMSRAGFVDEVLKEVYYNSTICSKKMRRFKLGVIFAIITIILSIFSGILYYYAYCVICVPN